MFSRKGLVTTTTATTIISSTKTPFVLSQKLQRHPKKSYLSNYLQQQQQQCQHREYHSYDHPPPPGPFTSLQSQILSAAILHVPKYGFSQISLARGANDIGLIDASTNLFPRGPFSLVHYYLYIQRLALKSRLHQAHADEQRQSIEAKAKALTWWRLEANKDIIHHWSEAIALIALTSNVQTAVKELSLLMDEIWYLSGDTSVDTTWYTKRAYLATIYTSTELFMTNDKSSDFKETKQFLERRFTDVQKVGSTLEAVGQWGSFTTSAVLNILRSKGMPI